MGEINFKKPIYKLTWDRAKGTIFAYDKQGHLQWGVAEGADLTDCVIIRKDKETQQP